MSNVIGADKFIKALNGLENSLKNEVTTNTLNVAVNRGLAVAKKTTPVGVYNGHVEFVTSKGQLVSFDVTKKQGGTLRRSWKTEKLSKNERKLYNNVEYALYVDQGHRKVKYIDGGEGKRIPIEAGWVPGKFMLKKAIDEMGNTLQDTFSKELDKAKKRNGL